MGRTKNNTEEIKTKEDSANVITSPVPKVNLDISALVSEARGRYGKKQKGLADDLVTGTEISLPTSDDAYILSDKVSFWKPLTGVKGIPYGRIIQIAGKADSGKSTAAMLFMTAAQYAGTLVILWDSEKKFDTARFKNRMGGDPSQLVVTRNKTITEGARQVASFVKLAKEQNPNIKIFIVWDSVGATLNSSQNDDDDTYSKQPGVSARETNWAIQKFNKLIETYRNIETGEETIAVCCINQVYANIGSVGHKEKGGSGLEYFSSVILQLSRKGDLNRIRNGQKIKYGITTRAKVRKNHLFSGEDCLAELDLVVSSDGIELADSVKNKKTELVGWDDSDD